MCFVKISRKATSNVPNCLSLAASDNLIDNTDPILYSILMSKKCYGYEVCIEVFLPIETSFSFVLSHFDVFWHYRNSNYGGRNLQLESGVFPSQIYTERKGTNTFLNYRWRCAGNIRKWSSSNVKQAWPWQPLDHSRYFYLATAKTAYGPYLKETSERNGYVGSSNYFADSSV